jgi:hypothetical protein
MAFVRFGGFKLGGRIVRVTRRHQGAGGGGGRRPRPTRTGGYYGALKGLKKSSPKSSTCKVCGGTYWAGSYSIHVTEFEHQVAKQTRKAQALELKPRQLTKKQVDALVSFRVAQANGILAIPGSVDNQNAIDAMLALAGLDPSEFADPPDDNKPGSS